MWIKGREVFLPFEASLSSLEKLVRMVLRSDKE